MTRPYKNNPFYTFVPDTQAPIDYKNWWEVFDLIFPRGQHTVNAKTTDVNMKNPYNEITIVNDGNIIEFAGYKKISRDPANIKFLFNVAGLDPKKIAIHSIPSKNIFQIKYTEENEQEGKSYHLYSGGFDSSFYNLHEIESEINNGILTVTLNENLKQGEEIITTQPTIKE